MSVARQARWKTNADEMSSTINPLDSDTWGVVHEHLSTHELFRFKAISKSWRCLVVEGALLPEKVRGPSSRPNDASYSILGH